MILSRGTKVFICTTNGGETTAILNEQVELASDGLPLYPFGLTSLHGGVYVMMPTRVRSFTVVAA